MNIKSGLIILLIFFIYSNQSEHCDDETFLNQRDYLCRQYTVTGGSCQIVNNACIPVLSDCSQGTQNNCESIQLIDTNGQFLTDVKCVWDRTCKKELKTCRDLGVKNCRNLHDTETNPTERRCGIINNECVQYKDDCNDASQANCNYNIPKVDGSIFTKICEWGKNTNNVDACLTKDRVCTNTYLEGLTCLDLTITSETDREKKKCILIEADKKCVENYQTCEDATGAGNTICKSTIPLDKDNNFNIMSDYICDWGKATASATQDSCYT